MKAILQKWLYKKANQHAQQRASRWLVLLDAAPNNTEQAEQFSAWLKRDPRNQKAFLYVQALQQAAAAQSRPVLTPDAHEVFNFNRWLFLATPLVATLLLAVLILKPLITVEHYETTKLRSTILLSDGSSLTLQPNTLLDTHFSDKQRLAKLSQGEVFFDVAHDTARPFIVETPSGRVTVLGTQFSVSAPSTAFGQVRSDQTEPNTTNNSTKPRVTVIAGRVAVENLQNEKTELIADQTITLDTQGQDFHSERTNAREAIAWRKEKFVFREQPLAQVITILNEHFGRDLQLGSHELADLSVDAVLRADDFQFAVEMITQSLSLTAIPEANGIIRLTR